MPSVLSAVFRTSTRRWTSRPPANCKAARRAWDEAVASGDVIWIQLLDGYWGIMRPGGEIEEIEAQRYVRPHR